MAWVILAGMDESGARVFRSYRGPLARQCVPVHDEESLYAYCTDEQVAALVIGPRWARAGYAAQWLGSRQPEAHVIAVGEGDPVEGVRRVDDLGAALELLEGWLSA